MLLLSSPTSISSVFVDVPSLAYLVCAFFPPLRACITESTHAMVPTLPQNIALQVPGAIDDWSHRFHLNPVLELFVFVGDALSS